jgi:enamine deaminase RidA (YjgF/YER057c/UK114 family)
MAIGLITYNDATRKEDVVDIITNVDFKSTPFISRIGESVAMNTLHEWLVDTYAAAAANTGIEGADVSIVDLTQPTRKTNVVQLFQKVIAVSDTELALAHYGATDPFTYQTNKKMIEIARDIELAAILGTRASGASGVARSMDGVIALLTSNKTAQTSGTSFTKEILNNLLKMVYDAGTDESVDLIMVGSYLKQVIDTMTTNITQNINASEYTVIQRISTYISSYGEHEVVIERNIPAGSIVGVDTSKFNLAWLSGRRMAVKPLGKTGSSTKALIEGECTLVCLNEKSSFASSGYFRG